MRGDKVLTKGVAKYIRKAIGNNAYSIDESFTVGDEYPFKKIHKKIGNYVTYEIKNKYCDAPTFKQHFIITKEL